jgi:hypothetical protein
MPHGKGKTGHDRPMWQLHKVKLWWDRSGAGRRCFLQFAAPFLVSGKDVAFVQGRDSPGVRYWSEANSVDFSPRSPCICYVYHKTHYFILIAAHPKIL